MQKQSAETLQALRDDPERGMLCIDWNNDDLPISLRGDEGEDNYQRFEAVLVPCNYVHTKWGWDKDSIHPECEPSLEKQIEYIGPSHWLFYVN